MTINIPIRALARCESWADGYESVKVNCRRREAGGGSHRLGYHTMVCIYYIEKIVVLFLSKEVQPKKSPCWWRPHLSNWALA